MNQKAVFTAKGLTKVYEVGEVITYPDESISEGVRVKSEGRMLSKEMGEQ
jgi:hypothetical protein